VTSLVLMSEGTAVFADGMTGSMSCPVISPGAGSARYNPRLLGGGSVVPYIGAWTGEANCPTYVVRRPDRGIGYTDETILDRDQWGVLWTRIGSRVGVGNPLFKKLHPVRQRRAMRRLLCQVCAQPADQTEEGSLWLVPAGERNSGPEGMTTIQPPLCVDVLGSVCECARRCEWALRPSGRTPGCAG
jgi:hypothetical protein